MAEVETLSAVAPGRHAPGGEGSRSGCGGSAARAYLYRAAGDQQHREHKSGSGSEGSPRKSVGRHSRRPGRDSPKQDSPKRGSPRRGSPESSGEATSGGSLQSSGSFGPTLPEEATPAEISARVSKDMRIFTRDGCPRLSEVVGQEIEAWSGRRWIKVRVAIAPPSAAQFYRVKLDDGTCLVCTGDHPWAVIADAQIVPILTRDLRTDLAISPFILFDTADLGGTPVPHAYAMGAAFGRKMADNYKLKDGLPAQIFRMDPPSLGQFVAGWMDAQKGTLFGCPEAIHDLQVVIHRLGIYHTYVEDLGTFCALGLSQEDGARIPNPKGSPREYRRTVSSFPRVVEVFATGGGRKRAYTITSDDPRAKTVVLDGVLTLC